MAYFPTSPDRVDAGNSSTTPLLTLAVTGASYSGTSLVLTGAWGGGGANAYVGIWFNVLGFTGVAVGNNGYFICTASSAGSVTLSVDGGYNGIAGTPTAAQAFTGTPVDCIAASISGVAVLVFADQISAANGLQIQWSEDNVNWGDYSASSTNTTVSSVSDTVRARYYRIVYINGTTTQGAFRLQTIQLAR